MESSAVIHQRLRTALEHTTTIEDFQRVLENLFKNEQTLMDVPNNFPPFWKAFSDDVKQLVSNKLRDNLVSNRLHTYDFTRFSVRLPVLGAAAKKDRQVNRRLLRVLYHKQIASEEEFQALYFGHLEMTWHERHRAHVNNLEDVKRPYLPLLNKIRNGGTDITITPESSLATYFEMGGQVDAALFMFLAQDYEAYLIPKE